MEDFSRSFWTFIVLVRLCVRCRLLTLALIVAALGEFHIPSGVSKSKVRLEAEFWGLDVASLGDESDSETQGEAADIANQSQNNGNESSDDEDEESEEPASPVRKPARTASKKVSLAVGVSIEEAIAFSKLPMPQRYAKAVDLAHHRERSEILKGVSFLTSACKVRFVVLPTR